MDIVLLILGFVFLIAGFVGCVLPILPGPPFSWVGLLLLSFTNYSNLSVRTMVITCVLAVVITIIDFFVPAYATKMVGGTKWGVRGCALGLLLGLFFPPLGFLIFPFIAALVAEYIYALYVIDESQTVKTNPFVSALGSFIGLLFGIVLKLVYCSFAFYLFVKELIIYLS